MDVRDSRRLTGPNLLTDQPGAVLDIALEPAEEERAKEAAAIWRRQAESALEAVGWGAATLVSRIFPGGMSLAFEAPIDALYAATEVNEWAWEAASLELAGQPVPAFDDHAERLRATIAGEVNPKLLELREAARAHGVTFLSDDDYASVGLGAGSRTWPVGELPNLDEIDWSQVHDVPVGLVTGTNGKTTTVRLLAAMIRAAGRVPGVSSTDWIAAGSDILDRGDYSGPGGARQVLRDRRVECAVLETARGGMLRRGVALDTADVALITNVAEDHLGEFGVHDVEAIAECKFIVARAAKHLVLNADDDLIRALGGRLDTPITWFSLSSNDPLVTEHVAAGGEACVLERGRLVWKGGGKSLPLIELADVPIALGGAARHNVANALAAIAVARKLGLGIRPIGEGLRQFESTPESNPGRLNVFTVGGATVVVDFAHNPHGIEALLEMAAAMPAKRRLITIGQAGDRDDESILELARTAWRARPDRVLIKEMTEYLRGRPEGEITAMLEAELRRQGAGDETLAHVTGELGAAEQALEWAEPGDLVLLIVHSHRDEVVELLTARAG